MEVPVTEYRRRLAHYHAIAREGEAVYVTEHGVPVVRVSAVGDDGDDAVLRQLVAEGGRAPTHPWGEPDEPVASSGPPSEDLIAEDRR